MAYAIDFTPSAAAELNAIRPFDRRRVVEAIEDQLTHEPALASRNRKKLEGVTAPFDFDPPLWELRVGEWRVFYDVEPAAAAVVVRAVRRKPPDRTTQEVLDEAGDA